MNKAIFSGAQILLKSLVKEGVKEVFGYPGGVVLPYMTLFICKMKLNIILFAMNKLQSMQLKATQEPQAKLELL